MVKHKGLATVQKHIKTDATAGGFADLAKVFLMSVGATLTHAPTYGSAARDTWLAKFWRKPGCDLLAGAISTLVAKVVSSSWYIEGPLIPALAYRDILLHKSNFGAGWDEMLQPWVTSYLDQDGGGLCERQRTSIGDHDGPALGFSHLDESKCTRTGNPEYPVRYDDGKKGKKIHHSQIMRIVDMADPRESYKSNGFCSVSRIITTALVLMDMVRYKRERLSDLPPAGLLILSNLTDVQWEDIMANYDTRQRNQGNTTWRDILVACGVDPSYKTTAEVFEFSKLPEHFNEKEAVETTIYSFALGLRMDARELWPVSSGPLGTAAETEIQHLKAKAKGAGIIFTAIERQLNSPLSLPQGLHFGFDFQDDEEDLQKAVINHQKLKNIRLMWETSPNRGEPEGIINTEEARRWALWSGIVPPAILGESLETESVYDTRMYGPMVRAYNDDRVMRMF